jgi:hypothetical protein
MTYFGHEMTSLNPRITQNHQNEETVERGSLNEKDDIVIHLPPVVVFFVATK